MYKVQYVTVLGTFKRQNIESTIKTQLPEKNIWIKKNNKTQTTTYSDVFKFLY